MFDPRSKWCMGDTLLPLLLHLPPLFSQELCSLKLREVKWLAQSHSGLVKELGLECNSTPLIFPLCRKMFPFQAKPWSAPEIYLELRALYLFSGEKSHPDSAVLCWAIRASTLSPFLRAPCCSSPLHHHHPLPSWGQDPAQPIKPLPLDKSA